MDETQLLEEQTEQAQDENNIIELPVAQQEQATEEEKTPLDLLLDEMDAMKARIAHLEHIAQNHGHELDGSVITQIAAVVIAHINNGIRKRMGAA